MEFLNEVLIILIIFIVVGLILKFGMKKSKPDKNY